VNFEQSDILKYRLTGAGFWLLLLIIIVPTWYANPVNFQPNAAPQEIEDKAIVNKVFVLPTPMVSEPKNSDLRVDRIEADDLQKSSVKPEKTVLEVAKKEKSTTGSFSWLIRIAAYKDKTKATELHDRLRYSYDSKIKYFPKSNYYSVRVGPYKDKEQALKDQENLNRILHVKTKIIKFNSA